MQIDQPHISIDVQTYMTKELEKREKEVEFLKTQSLEIEKILEEKDPDDIRVKFCKEKLKTINEKIIQTEELLESYKLFLSHFKKVEE
jgi:hypothetical protein